MKINQMRKAKTVHSELAAIITSIGQKLKKQANVWESFIVGERTGGKEGFRCALTDGFCTEKKNAYHAGCYPTDAC